MQSPLQFVTSRDGQRVVDLALALVWILFTKRHIDGFFEFHNPFLLLFIFSETLQVIIFLLRDRAVSVSQRPSAWIFGIVGTFVTLFFTPAQPTMAEWGGALIVLGVIFQVLGLYSLNRSFGIVAAVRSVKTKGMYRFVRHPMYASYILALASLPGLSLPTRLYYWRYFF
jgi:protein-S-isoprenylcysteine O-methyltransferase Ste14